MCVRERGDAEKKKKRYIERVTDRERERMRKSKKDR